ncbi:major facilitator superfamily domain-containing protein [Cercophora newfieldiana]|uniref:Major facilitator superfamily domain-containing protein n=1 Tax=Cercophora newfieldiana TaxID=92897 RepID=A0AA40CM21_9PEZI|nr:major facilitator superfamily domain-containing protein [Cercophora newfieldiana]
MAAVTTTESHGTPSPREARDLDKSPGVRQAEALSSVITTQDRAILFSAVFLVAFAYALDGVLRYTYQPLAAASFSQHSLLATINVLRAVVATAAQPTAGRMSDLFGRVELVCLSVGLYIVGTIIETKANGVPMFAVGALIYQIGYTTTILLIQVIIGDLTSTRARLLCSYIPNAPFLIITWVSGDVSRSVLGVTDWRWGIGMWCIIFPICAAPLVVTFLLAARRVRQRGLLEDQKAQPLPWGERLLSWFWRLDVIGIILIVAVFALILVPITIAGGFERSWKTPNVLAPLVLGLSTIPVFVYWQWRAPHPLVPFRIMGDRAVWAALGIALLLNWVWNLQGNYLFTVLRVAFDFDLALATRVSSFYTFFSVLSGCLLGFVVLKVRRLKVFILIGTCLNMVAFGLLIHYRGGESSRGGVIGAQVVLGIAGGMFPYPALASLQAVLDHEQLAVMTGLYLATYNLGAAFGNAMAGAIWTQVMPGELERRLAGFNNATVLATLAYGDPFTFLDDYPIDTPERGAVVDAYKHSQRILVVIGICMCVPLIGFAAALRNPKLNDNQTLAGDSLSVPQAAGDDSEGRRT